MSEIEPKYPHSVVVLNAKSEIVLPSLHDQSPSMNVFLSFSPNEMESSKIFEGFSDGCSTKSTKSHSNDTPWYWKMMNWFLKSSNLVNEN